MRPTVEEVTKLAMALGDQERLRVAEELVISVQPDEKWWEAWTAEANRRYERLVSGEAAELTLEEFWSDED
jgi:Putative addiction module component